jgi:hypothetical protein
MRILLACLSFLVGGFFLLCFSLGMLYIYQDRAEKYVKVHGWSALIGMQSAMAVLAALFLCAGVLVLQRKRKS